MNHWPIGVLRVRFRDQQNYVPAAWDDAAFDNVFLSGRHPLGVTNYWERNTLGHVDMSGSQVFPWLTINLDQYAQQQAPDGTMGPMLRTPIVQDAIRAAQEAGFNLEPFHGLVVFCVPEKPQAPFLDVGATNVAWGNRTGFAAFVSERTSHSVMAHEVGHALGLSHTFAANPWLDYPLEYGDGTCVMGGNYAFPDQVDPSLGVDPAYFTLVGPGTSGATLLSYIPGVGADKRIKHWDNTIVQSPQRMRIYARDTYQSPLIHVIDWPDVPAKKYALEYRRPNGFDRAVPHSVNVYTLMDISYPAVQDAPIWRTHIGLPYPVQGTGPQRWKDPQENFGVRMEEIADDGSWVEVTVGGHALLDGQGVRVSNVSTASETPWELVAGGLGKEVRLPIPPGCGVGSFSFEEYHLPHGITTVSLDAWGFKDPVYAWWVNGQPVPPAKSFASWPNVVGVLAQTTMPRPGSEITRLAQLNLRALARPSVGQLHLRPDMADGNYTLTVTARVVERAAPDNYLASVSTDVQIQRIAVEMSAAYEAAVTACARKFQDVANKYAESGPRSIDPSASASRNYAVLQRWAADVGNIAPGLAALFTATASAIRQAQPPREIRRAPPERQLSEAEPPDAPPPEPTKD